MLCAWSSSREGIDTQHGTASPQYGRDWQWHPSGIPNLHQSHQNLNTGTAMQVRAELAALKGGFHADRLEEVIESRTSMLEVLNCLHLNTTYAATMALRLGPDT